MRSIKGKIIRGFLLVIILVLMMGGANFFFTNQTNKQIGQVIEADLPQLQIADKLSLNIAENTSLMSVYLLYGQTNYYSTSFESLQEERKILQEELLAVSSSKEITEIVEKMQAWESLMDEEIFSIFNEDRELARANNKDLVEPMGHLLKEALLNLADQKVKTITTNGKRVINGGERNTILGASISGVTIVLSLLIAIIMANSVANPIVAVSRRMKIMAAGDLTHKNLETKAKDEIGVLIESVNEMTNQIRSMTQEIGDMSTVVKGRSEELSHSATEVTSGSQQAAATMEELSIASESQALSAAALVESMGELTETIHHANQYGQKASEVTTEVLTLTQKGNEAMDESVNKMRLIDENVRDAVGKVQRLNDHSKEISQLVNVISNIAEQTNLLALNAAIEAARAGEQGKGFAVVAGEVKKLAEQVGSSVITITELVSTIQNETKVVVTSLNDSFEQVESGTEQIRSTGSTFEEISGSIHNIVKQIQRISRDLGMIVNSADDMNTAISNIASISEEASAGIEETAATAEETTSSMQEITANAEALADISIDLDKLIRRFKV